MSFFALTSESVTDGHPDKVCDQISDAILDAYLNADPFARVASDCSITKGLVHIFGEITSSAIIKHEEVVRNTLKKIGYTNSSVGFDCNSCGIISTINEQSPDIANAIKKNSSLGAGDQGMMIGYACNETEELMPLPIFLANKLAQQIKTVRDLNKLDYLKLDGKTQVSVSYEENRPKSVTTVVVSVHHDESVSLKKIEKDIIELVIKKVIPEKYLSEETKYLVNPSGRFVRGGPEADSGLTGRKVQVDTYGGITKHGGGAFSGKDPTKVDRSGAYMARYIAKNIVASGIADRIEIQISYAIGVSVPVSVYVDAFETSSFTHSDLVNIIFENFDLRPQSIIESFDLRKAIYYQTASFGHFGRKDLSLPWEQLDKVSNLKKLRK